MSPDILLVTGATGQVGSAVVRAATDDGWKVRIIARNKGAAEAMFAGRDVDIIAGDLLDPAAHRRALSDVTHICNCAARVGDWGPAREYWDMNVHAFRQFLDELKPHGARLKKFVHLSSLGVYEPRDHFGTTEDEPPFKDGLDAYNQTKAASETLLLNHSVSSVSNTIVLRPGFIYGPGDRHVLPGLIKALRKGIFTFIGNGEQKLDQISVGNVAHAVMLALKSGPTRDRVFNITDREPVSRRIFVNTLADLLELSRPSRSIPKNIGWMLASTCDRIGRFMQLREPPVLSKARYKFLALNLEFSTERARKQLGYNPPEEFSAAIAAAARWYKEQGEVTA